MTANLFLVTGADNSYQLLLGLGTVVATLVLLWVVGVQEPGQGGDKELGKGASGKGADQ